MTTYNLFDGRGDYSMMPHSVYRCLMSRKWITYADVMADFLSKKSAAELPSSISKCDGYGELKKVFPEVCRLIKERVGDGSIEQQGNNRSRQFRYIGTDNDPLADIRNAKAINNIQEYWQFCQNSAGFFPTSWLEYFFKDCRDLIDIKKKRQRGEQVLSAGLDRMLENIDLLPFLYNAIVKKLVLSIDYKPYSEDARTLTFHPHYLKEYNGRWHLLGHAEQLLPEFGYNIALDRIVGKPREKYDIPYIAAPKGFYQQFFDHIVGVSHMPEAKVEEIHIRAHTKNMFKLTETKKIHHSQITTVPFGEHDDGKYGEFAMNVEVNNEFFGRILQMGAGLEIVSPANVREAMKSRIDDTAKLYK